MSMEPGRIPPALGEAPMGQLRRAALPLALLGAVGLVSGIAAAIVAGRVGLQAQLLLASGAVLVAAAVLLRPAAARRLLTGRQVRYGGNALIVSLALAGILVVLNMMGSRYHARWDVTAGRDYSLAPQTLQVLQGLESDVKVTAFLTRDYWAAQDVEDLLNEYRYASDRFEFELIDPELKPGVAQQWRVERDGVLVFVQGDRRVDVYGVSEQELTSALIKLTRQTTKGVYFTIGHGERDLASSEPGGYSQARALLEADQFQVGSLNLAVTSALPADLAVLVVAAPRVGFTEAETVLMREYLDAGGRLMVMAEPGEVAPLADLLAAWGLRFRNDIVVDPLSSMLTDLLTPVSAQYGRTPITRDMGSLATIFPTARSVELVDAAPRELLAGDLVRTSDRAYGETNLDAAVDGRFQMDEGTDTPGPLALAAIVEDLETGVRIVAVGDPHFASNQFLDAYGNKNLFANAIDWLALEEDLISIRSQPPEFRAVQPLNSTQTWLIFGLTVGLMPMLVGIAGAAVWLTRRSG